MGIEDISFPKPEKLPPRAFINEARIEVYGHPDVHLKGINKEIFLREMSRIWDRHEREYSEEEDAKGAWMLKVSVEPEPRH